MINRLTKLDRYLLYRILLTASSKMRCHGKDIKYIRTRNFEIDYFDKSKSFHIAFANLIHILNEMEQYLILFALKQVNKQIHTVYDDYRADNITVFRTETALIVSMCEHHYNELTMEFDAPSVKTFTFKLIPSVVYEKSNTISMARLASWIYNAKGKGSVLLRREWAKYPNAITTKLASYMLTVNVMELNTFGKNWLESLENNFS
jgi:hypothetical protein